MKIEFGKFLKEKRINKGISVRAMASKLDISVSYLSELESGVKLPPNSSKKGYGDLIQRIIEYLELNQEDENKMRELADSVLGSNGYMPNDMTKYVEDMPLAMAALRKAKNANLSESQWQKIIEQKDKK